MELVKVKLTDRVEGSDPIGVVENGFPKVITNKIKGNRGDIVECSPSKAAELRKLGLCVSPEDELEEKE